MRFLDRGGRSGAAGGTRAPAPRRSARSPTTAATLSAISPSRRAAKVAIETWSSWLAEVGIESTLAGMGQRLVLRGERRRRDLRHHEARVEPARFDQEGRQAGEARRRPGGRSAARTSRRSRRARSRAGRRRSPPARRGSCRRRARRPRRRRSADCRRRRWPRSRACRHEAHRVEQRAHHLRLAAERVRVLHPVPVPVLRPLMPLRASSARKAAATSI